MIKILWKKINFLFLTLVFQFILLVPLPSLAFADIFGHWKFVSIIYQGQAMPKPNPELKIEWTFFRNGTERLYWDHGDQNHFCERLSWFRIEEDRTADFKDLTDDSSERANLMDEVIFLNPLNSADCQQDPDMQMPRVSTTPVSWHGPQLYLHLKASEAELIYVLERDERY